MSIKSWQAYDLEEQLQALSALSEIGRLDVSVSVPELGTVFKDDKTSPLGKTQQDIAAIYNVKRAFIMTGGTTQANVLAVATVAKPGSKILLQRNSHISVFAPVINLGLEPVFISPKYLPERDVMSCITPEDLEETFKIYPDISTVFLTSPNYFGIVGDLRALIRIAHDHNARVIVDEAHGSYFNFYRRSPIPLAAEHAEADIVTQSTHKTLGALSQGSLVLLNDDSLAAPMYEAINTLGYVSTSFYYLILLSVSIAVSQMDFYGEEAIKKAIRMSEYVRGEINKIDGLKCFGQEIIDPARGVFALDPLRITVNVREWGITGYDLEAELHKRGVFQELATLDNVLFLMTPFDEMSDGQYIVDVLSDLKQTLKQKATRSALPPPPPPKKLLTPREAFYHPHKRIVPLAEAVGKASCETIAAYPPGTAVIVMGEQVNEEIIAYLQRVDKCGGYLKGLVDTTLSSLTVVDV